MSFNFNYSLLNRVNRPDLFLANPNQEVIGCLKQNTELVFDLYLNSISKMTFKYYKYIDNKENPYYNSIENKMTILAVGISWFQVTFINEQNDGDNPYKEVECSSLENEFTTKRLTSFGQLGNTEDWDGGLDLYKLYDITNTSKSIMHIILAELPSWSIGTIDSNINNGWRSFNDDDTDAYTFLTGSVSETYDCFFIFDTFAKTVSAYSLESLNDHTGIILSYRNLIKNINFKSNANDIRTRMSVYGGDDRGNGNLNIIPCNATGTSVIANYDYYIDKMSSGLKIAYANYKNAYVTNSTKLSNALTTLGNLYNELNDLEYKSPANNSEDWAQYGLAHLLEFQDKYSTIMSESLGNSTIYNQNRAKYNAITSQVNVRKQQVISKQAQINAQIALRDSYVVKFENYLTLDQRKELSRLAHDTTFTDSSFITTTKMTDKEILEMQLSLKNLAEKKLNRICKPQYTLEVDVANYMNIPEFKSFTGRIQLGSILTVDWDEKGLGRYNVESRVLYIHINFDDFDDFSLTFSSKNSLDGEFALDELQQQVISTSISQAIGSSSWTTIKNNNNEVNMFISSALNAAKNKIVNSENQSVVFGEFGLQIKQFNKDTGGFDPKQIWMANGMIAFSNDGFETVKMALGEVEVNGVKYYGVIGEAIVGKLIIGNSMFLQNGDASLTFTSNGLTITNGINTVKIDPTNNNLFQILKGNSKVLYFDNYGNGTFTGKLVSGSIASSSISGSTISGSTFTSYGYDGIYDYEMTLDAASITFSNLTNNLSLVANYKNIGWTGSSSVKTLMTISDLRTPTLLAQTITPYASSSITFSGESIFNGASTFKGDANFTGALTRNNSNVITEGTWANFCAAKYHTHSFSTDDITASITSYDNIGFGGSGSTRSTAVSVYNFNNSGSSSDVRLKENIKEIDFNVEDFYMRLNALEYNFKDGIKADKKINFGLRADDIVGIFNELGMDWKKYAIVKEQKNLYLEQDNYTDGTHLEIFYENMEPLHIIMIQKMRNKITELETKLAEHISKE